MKKNKYDKNIFEDGSLIQCKEITKRGSRCLNTAKKNSSFCGLHQASGNQLTNIIRRLSPGAMWGIISIVVGFLIALIFFIASDSKTTSKTELKEMIDLSDVQKRKMYRQEMELIFREEREYLNSQYKYGYSFLVIEEDKIYMKVDMKEQGRFKSDWSKLEIKTEGNKIDFLFPELLDTETNARVTRTYGTFYKGKNAGIAGVNLMGCGSEAVYKKMTGYGDIIIVGLFEHNPAL